MERWRRAHGRGGFCVADVGKWECCVAHFVRSVRSHDEVWVPGHTTVLRYYSTRTPGK